MSACSQRSPVVRETPWQSIYRKYLLRIILIRRGFLERNAAKNRNYFGVFHQNSFYGALTRAQNLLHALSSLGSSKCERVHSELKASDQNLEIPGFHQIPVRWCKNFLIRRECGHFYSSFLGISSSMTCSGQRNLDIVSDLCWISYRSYEYPMTVEDVYRINSFFGGWTEKYRSFSITGQSIQSFITKTKRIFQSFRPRRIFEIVLECSNDPVDSYAFGPPTPHSVYFSIYFNCPLIACKEKIFCQRNPPRTNDPCGTMIQNAEADVFHCGDVW